MTNVDKSQTPVERFQQALEPIRSHFIEYAGHRGGGDVVDVIAQAASKPLGDVHVPGLLGLPSPTHARVAIGRAMECSTNEVIRVRSSRDPPWELCLRNAITNALQPLPPDCFWPTLPFFQDRVGTGAEIMTVQFMGDDHGQLKRGRALDDDGPRKESRVREHGDGDEDDGDSGGDEKRRVGGTRGGGGHTGAGGCGGGGGSSRGCADTDVLHARAAFTHADGAPVPVLRAVLFTSASPGSLFQQEASLLHHHGLTPVVVCPESVVDIASCLDRLRPRLVVVSATHCGKWPCE